MVTNIISWNIQHGGGNGPRQQLAKKQLLAFDADLLIISEFRLGRSGEAIKDHLHGAGYVTSHPKVEPNINTVLVASRMPIVNAWPWWPSAPDLRHLWYVETCGIRLCAVYMPLNYSKIPYWQALTSPSADAQKLDLVIGDFNTGNNTLDREPKSSAFTAAHLFDEFGAGAFVDLWRSRNPDAREYTWFSTRGRNGFRLDHAFSTIAFNKRVANCRYLPEPRLQGCSDHSAILVEVAHTASARSIQQQSPTGTTTSANNGIIYAIRDPARPDLIKIGKDSKWPQRLRQAQSHSPRTFEIVGIWSIGQQDKAGVVERKVLSAFERHKGSVGREWRITEGDVHTVEEISRIIGCAPSEWIATDLKPYDDWRDYARPKRSDKLRRLWIGRENHTGRLKIVHSPHIDRFRDFCPTYSCFGIRWLEAWAARGIDWHPSTVLNRHDELVVSVWQSIVDNLGYGQDDSRVGWLRDGVSLDEVRRAMGQGQLSHELMVG